MKLKTLHEDMAKDVEDEEEFMKKVVIELLKENGIEGYVALGYSPHVIVPTPQGNVHIECHGTVRWSEGGVTNPYYETAVWKDGVNPVEGAFFYLHEPDSFPKLLEYVRRYLEA